MNEIQRVHIAKVTYSIETSAKKELFAYIEALRKYADDEIVDDIEARITEILADRGVKPDGVIDSKDVAAIIKQLGKPEEFLDEAVATEAEPVRAGRKFFRNPNGAWLGGLCTGVASYFKQSVWVVRWLFILLTLATSGFSLVAYIIVWVLVPAAKTPADLLQLRGKPVTAIAIKDASPVALGHDKLALKIIRVITGIAFVLAALGVVALTVVLTIAYGRYANQVGFRATDIVTMPDYSTTPWHWAQAAFVAAGSLAAVTLLFIASMLFMARARKGVIITTIIIGIIAILCLGSAVGLSAYQQRRFEHYLNAHTSTLR